MISNAMQDAFNRQMNEELFSSYLYLAMAAYFENEGLPGMAAWMEAQSAGEDIHARKFYSQVIERGGRVKLPAIKEPLFEWNSPVHAFEEALKHEQYITSCINDLVGMSREENDYASEIFLQWFVTEQVEEEDSVGSVLDQLKLAENSPQGMLFMDRELGKRGGGTEAEE